MRRADRLFQIVQYLRGGRLVTARRLAERLEVSERTIYRDIADLQSTGVPIDGEAGVGYILREGFDLPPLMFTRDEIVALVAGARLVRAWGGASMARAAEEALIKIESVVPEDDRQRIRRTEIHAISMNITADEREMIDRVQKSADRNTVLSIRYRDAEGIESARDVRPLGLWFWGKVWTLVAWCELREDFRAFRTDRIIEASETGRSFRAERGKTLADFYRMMEIREDRPPTSEAGG
jgi:predicted DNA-binding transcriptional regulator YafY